MWWGLACSPYYSFSLWWGGEASQELGVQSADVSAIPGVFTLFKQVSSFLSKSLDHRGQKVCGCVLVTILKPFLLEVIYLKTGRNINRYLYHTTYK
jgi:hypothetical protein